MAKVFEDFHTPTGNVISIRLSEIVIYFDTESSDQVVEGKPVDGPITTIVLKNGNAIQVLDGVRLLDDIFNSKEPI